MVIGLPNLHTQTRPDAETGQSTESLWPIMLACASGTALIGSMQSSVSWIGLFWLASCFIAGYMLAYLMWAAVLRNGIHYSTRLAFSLLCLMASWVLGAVLMWAYTLIF